MAVFIEKAPVTSSNCYGTIKKLQYCSNLAQMLTGHDIFNLKFPVTMTTMGLFKIAKNHSFALFFSIKTDFNVLQLFNGLI
jgi:hypothetical protein